MTLLDVKKNPVVHLVYLNHMIRLSVIQTSFSCFEYCLHLLQQYSTYTIWIFFFFFFWNLIVITVPPSPQWSHRKLSFSSDLQYLKALVPECHCSYAALISLDLFLLIWFYHSCLLLKDVNCPRTFFFSLSLTCSEKQVSISNMGQNF